MRFGIVRLGGKNFFESLNGFGKFLALERLFALIRGRAGLAEPDVVPVRKPPVMVSFSAWRGRVDWVSMTPRARPKSMRNIPPAMICQRLKRAV